MESPSIPHPLSLAGLALSHSNSWPFIDDVSAFDDVVFSDVYRCEPVLNVVKSGDGVVLVDCMLI